ncbi:MAG: HD domain-containing protein [Clostridia bacterium]|nr:HD domain-containing protein [Clostridia bacterium]
MLIFFLLGYLFVGIFANPHLVTALILFFGSVFVAIVLTLLTHLMNTAKERGIDIAEVLVGVIDARDPNLNGHSRYVQEVTMLLYRYLPASMKKDINPVSLEYAARLHDVGKLGVPEAILNKPDSLNEDEWKVMRGHPRTGVKILQPLRTFANITPWIEYHHERPDGKGYYGLKKEEIPLPARIIAIADTYSAITMRRSYKPPRSHEEAVQIIQEAAGTQLDRDLVEIFLTIPKDELERCMPEEVKY